MTVKKMAVYKACVISTLLCSRQTCGSPETGDKTQHSPPQKHPVTLEHKSGETVSDIGVLSRVGLSSIYTPYSDYTGCAGGFQDAARQSTRHGS